MELCGVRVLRAHRGACLDLDLACSLSRTPEMRTSRRSQSDCAQEDRLRRADAMARIAGRISIATPAA
jgi:hypothetical protein